MVVVKCVLSAVAAWGIGMVAVDTTQVGFAPFTALLVVQPSVYGSVLQSTRYVAAVFTGALLAGVAGLSVGAQLWSFGIVVLVALILGHLRFFREQGKQVSVVAAFALAGGAASSGEQLGELLLMVAIGSLCALVVNMLLAPAIRFRDAQEGVLDFVDALRYVVEGIAEDLRNGLETEAVGQRVRAAEALDNTSHNAQAVVERQEYTVRLNPRRIFSRARRPPRSPGQLSPVDRRVRPCLTAHRVDHPDPSTRHRRICAQGRTERGFPGGVRGTAGHDRACPGHTPHGGPTGVE